MELSKEKKGSLIYNFIYMLTLPTLNQSGDRSGISRIEFDHANIGYPGAVVLNDISIQIPSGSQVAVVGPNGAGKSTLFKALVGLIPLISGEIRIHGLSVAAHHDCISYIPQREEVDWKFPVSVWDVVMMGRFNNQGWLRRPSQKDKKIVQEALERLNIDALTNTPIGNLSGGQQQRVFLARAVAQQPHILILDEPFNGVDFNTYQVILTLLDSLKSMDVTVLISTHDLNFASERFQKVILLNRKLIEYGHPKQVFTSENLQLAFGNQLLFLDNHQTVLVDECCPNEEEIHL